MTTRQTPDAVREAVALTITDAGYHLRKYRPHCLEALEKALDSLDSRAGNDLTPRERIARAVAWEHFGIAWHHMEKQSHADVLAMVDRMLDSRAGDAGPAGEVEAFRRGAEAMQRKLADALRDHLNSRAAAIANGVTIPEYQA